MARCASSTRTTCSAGGMRWRRPRASIRPGSSPRGRGGARPGPGRPGAGHPGGGSRGAAGARAARGGWCSAICRRCASWPARRRHAARVPFGYLGSANPWNLAAVRALDAALAAAGRSCPGCSPGASSAAGRTLAAAPRAPLLLPHVPDAAAFYAGADCVLNPMAGGTGLKIKTVEALAFGRPRARHPRCLRRAAGRASGPPLRRCRGAGRADARVRGAARPSGRGLRWPPGCWRCGIAAAVAAQQDALAARLRALVA